MNQEFANRTLETRNPQELLIVTSAHLDKFPEHRGLLAKYYDKRGDRGLDPDFVESVKAFGAIHTPVFITHVEELQKDVVVAGRRRVRAAIAAGFEEVPVIVHSNEAKLNVALELTENFNRSENTAVESAYGIRKALATGMNQEEVATMCGITGAAVSHILSLGDMPKIVHEYIKKGKLTESAALTIKKAVGKPAAKATGLTATYDEKEVKAFLEGLDEQVRLAGGTKIKGKDARAARNGTPSPSDAFNKKDWKALTSDSNVPNPYVALISFFIGDISLSQARQQGAGHLDWLVKPVHQPKPKKVKEPKVKGEGKAKKSKKETVVEVTPEQSKSALKDLFGTN
jgi:ParB/RepB/Spo0J family partition protein